MLYAAYYSRRARITRSLTIVHPIGLYSSMSEAKEAAKKKAKRLKLKSPGSKKSPWLYYQQPLTIDFGVRKIESVCETLSGDIDIYTISTIKVL